MAISAGVLYFLLLVVGLSIAAPEKHHHHHHHKERRAAKERQLTPVEQRIKTNIDNYLEIGHKQPFRIPPYKPHLDTPHCQEPTYSGHGCCLEDELVDTDKLGLKKDIDAMVFTAFKCGGSCLQPNPFLGEEEPVEGECRPYSYSGLTIDYYDENGKSTTRLVPQTLVRSCSCN